MATQPSQRPAALARLRAVLGPLVAVLCLAAEGVACTELPPPRSTPPPARPAAAAPPSEPAAPCDEPRRRVERALLAARRELDGPGAGAKAASSRARALLEPAARDAAELGERASVLAVRMELARAAARLAPAEAATLYRQAIALARELGDPAAAAAALQGLAPLLPDGDRLPTLNAALALRRQSGDEPGSAGVLAAIGEHYRNHLDAERALASYLEALQLERRHEGPRPRTLVELGRLYGKRGETDRSRAYLEAGFAEAEAAGDVETQAFALQEAARLDIDQGELQGAYDECAQAHRLLASQGITAATAWAAVSLATSLLYLGEIEQARQRYEEALKDFEIVADAQGRSYALLMLGSTWEAVHQPARALTFFEHALELIRSRGVAVEESMALYDLGKAHNELGRPQQAVGELERALAMAAAESPVRRAQILVELGNAHVQAGDPARAAADFRRAIELSGRAPVLEVAAQAGVARAERDRGDLSAARTAIERALGIVERLRTGVLRPDQRISFLASLRAYYELWVDLLVRLDRLQPGAGHDGEALAASEQARARGLLDLLSRERVDLRRGIPEELGRRAAEIDERIARLQIRLWSSSLPLSEAEVQRLKRELAQAEEEDKELDAELWRRQPVYAAVREPRPLPLAEIQRLLDERTALLEFFVGRERSYLFVVTRRALTVHPLPPRHQLEALVQRLRSALEQESRLRARLLASDAHELYRLLLLPAAPELRDKRLLLVVPDGPLYSLSFEALLTRPAPAGGAADGRAMPFLLRQWSVAYVPSASVLAQLPVEPRGSTGPGAAGDPAAAGKLFVGFGDPDALAPPLAAARDEVRRIASLFPAERTAVFLGRDATEENVKNGPAAAARYLHFAMHGFLDESTPEHSGLRLARAGGGSAQDGLLQVREVFNLELHADLVVLSACKTGLGKEVSGEGVLGMTRAFLYAGAASVVVSLWQVDDESTSELMVSFYRQLAATGDKSEALRRAKLELADRSRYFQHPHYWAPFILVGRPR